MAHQSTYPLGGTNKMWEPMHILVDLGFTTAMTIKGRTCDRDGSTIKIFDGDKQELGKFSYSFAFLDMNYHIQMAKDAAEVMNLMFDLQGEDFRVKPEELVGVMYDLRQKCESRYGNLLPDIDHEVLVTFTTNK